MHLSLRVATIAVALIGSVGVAGAAQLNLTSAQKQTIFQSVASEKGQVAPVATTAQQRNESGFGRQGIRLRQTAEQGSSVDRPQGSTRGGGHHAAEHNRQHKIG